MLFGRLVHNIYSLRATMEYIYVSGHYLKQLMQCIKNQLNQKKGQVHYYYEDR